MYCRKCGKEIVDEAVLCPYCGVAVQEGFNFAQPVNQTNGMAIAGFVCSFLIPILGWIFGGIGLYQSKKRKGAGKGFSISALAISSVVFTYNFVFWMWFFGLYV